MHCCLGEHVRRRTFTYILISIAALIALLIVSTHSTDRIVQIREMRTLEQQGWEVVHSRVGRRAFLPWRWGEQTMVNDLLMASTIRFYEGAANLRIVKAQAHSRGIWPYRVWWRQTLDVTIKKRDGIFYLVFWPRGHGNGGETEVELDPHGRYGTLIQYFEKSFRSTQRLSPTLEGNSFPILRK